MKKALVFLSILIAGSASAQAYMDPWWGGSVGGATSNTSSGTCVAHTISGPIYGVISAGIFQSAGAPGTNLNPVGGAPVNAVSTGSSDMYINRVDYTGTFNWAIAITGALEQVPLGMVANSTDLYVVGYFAGTTVFDAASGFSLASTPAFPGVFSRDIFIARYDVNGNFVWAHRIGSTRGDTATSIAFDPAGDLVVTGNFQGIVDFDPLGGTTNLISTGSNPDAFIARFSSATGALMMAQTFGGPGPDHPHSVHVDPAGRIVVGGFYASAACDFDPSGATLNPGVATTGAPFNAGVDAFVAQYTAAGALNFARTFGTPYRDQVTCVVTDAASEIYFTGAFQKGSITFTVGAGTYVADNTTAAANGFADIITGKYNTAGAMQWVFDIGNTFDDAGTCIELDTYNHVYIAGYYQQTGGGGGGSVDFDPIGGDPTADQFSLSVDMFVARYYMNTGNYNDVDVMPCSGNDRLRDIDVYSPDHFLWATGQAQETAGPPNFDMDPDPATTLTVPITSVSMVDAVLLEYRFISLPPRLAKPTVPHAYPNPTTGTFSLDNLVTNDMIEIYSLDGRHCETWTAPNDGKMEISLGALDNGVYIINILHAGELRETERVVLAR